MRFSKISITKKSVDLTRETKDENGALEEVHLTSPERPLSAFSDALQAFRPYVVDLLELPDEWDERLTITTLNLSEDKNGLRGLIVTAIKPVPKAYDKPLVLNTPLVREAGENAIDESHTLSEDVLKLIHLAEDEATRYAKGEREQLELMPRAASSENTDAFNDRAAAAEVASTRKPRAKKAKAGRDFIPGVGDVVNPGPGLRPNDETLREMLAATGRDVPIDAIARWTSSERDAAQRWADGRGDGQEPECVQRDGTGELLDDWIERHPARVTEEGAQEILAASEHG